MKSRAKTTRFAVLAVLLLSTILIVGSNKAQAVSTIAYDMVGSAEQNLVSYSNPYTDAFSSAADGFQKYQRNVSPSIPFSVLDDSLSIFTGDSLGIIKEGNTDIFFGVTDTENGDNSGEVSATWVFDVGGASDLGLSIDIGAMGDFETSDYFVWEYQFDGGPVQTALASTVDEAGSFTYTLEGGASFTLDDPMLVNGTILTNDLATFTTSLNGAGSELTLTLKASTDGGSEAFAFQNLVIEAGVTPPTGQPLPLVEDFDDCTLAGWEIVSVDADTGHTWSCNSTFSNIEANGFGDTAPANEWLITPALNMNAQENDALRFRTQTSFTDAGIPYPQLSVQYSTDYDGSGDPTAASWTPLSGITFSPENSGAWTDSGIIDLSGVSGSNVYFAFQYQSSGTGGGSAARWRLDGINFFVFEPVGQCGDTATLIHAIQGIGDDGSAPYVGTKVEVEAVVVGDFQEGDGDAFNTDLDGFYVQEEDADADSDPLTSEGIFVYAPGPVAVGDVPDVAVGDVVRVAGTVGESSGQTQIGNVTSLIFCDPDLFPAATDVTLPVADVSDLEAFEGMFVRFPQELVISEYFNFDRFGEIVLAVPVDGADPALPNRPFQPTAVFEPGSAEAAALADLNARSRITLDDARTEQNPDPAVHPNGAVFDLGNRFRGGDLVQYATGVLGEGFGRYRIQPTSGGSYIVTNPRPTGHAEVGGNIEVAAFNVLNYFTTFGSRGANDQEEFDRQRTKIIAALQEIDADVVGLIEIENNTEAIADLVTGLNDAMGAGTYAYVDTGAIGTDEIKVAFIYKSADVSLVGEYAVLDDPAFVSPNTPDPKNRPALAQTFIDNETGGIFTAVVNHFKSKGSTCDTETNIGDDDPEQGSCNGTRTAAARVLADWLATDPTGSGDEDFIIIGDLNAYDKEDPIRLLQANGYTDLVFAGGGEYAYSYVFDGQFGYLDYAMANAGLSTEVTGTTVWNINSDEPDILDYDTTFKQPPQEALYEPNAYRSSDHDPVIVGLDVCDEIPPELSVSVSPDTLWPPNHKYVTVTPSIAVSDNFDPNPTVTLVSVTSNEPDDGLGDGDTPNDIVVNPDGTIDLRAERSGTGEGRVYTVTYVATDACGNSTLAAATVTVPHEQAPGE